MKELKFCLFGFGNAGREFCRLLLQKQDEIKEIYGYNVQVTDIATKSKGILSNREGIDLYRALTEVDAGAVRGRVYPRLFDEKDIFGNIDSTSSIVSITTDLMGEICIVERNPEIQQTAYGIYSDILTLIKRIK